MSTPINIDALADQLEALGAEEKVNINDPDTDPVINSYLKKKELIAIGCAVIFDDIDEQIEARRTLLARQQQQKAWVTSVLASSTPSPVIVPTVVPQTPDNPATPPQATIAPGARPVTPPPDPAASTPPATSGPAKPNSWWDKAKAKAKELTKEPPQS